MDNYNTYIDLIGKACLLMKNGKTGEKECIDLLEKIAIIWDKLTEEEQILADEQTLRTRLWMGV